MPPDNLGRAVLTLAMLGGARNLSGWQKFARLRAVVARADGYSGLSPLRADRSLGSRHLNERSIRLGEIFGLGLRPATGNSLDSC